MNTTHNEEFENTAEDDKVWDELLGSKEGQALLNEMAENALKEAGLVKPDESK